MTTYTPNIPQPGDIPAQSQDQILQNFQSIDDGTNGFARNHVSLTNGTVGQRGKHNFLELVNLGAAPSPPSGLAGQENTYYANAVTSTGDGGYSQTETFFIRGTSSKRIQMTAGKNADVPATVISASTNTFVTFLPGGLLFQGGFISGFNSGSTITWPVPMVTFITGSLSRQETNTANRGYVQYDTASGPTATGAVVNVRNEAGNPLTNQTIFYTVIGVA